MIVIEVLFGMYDNANSLSCILSHYFDTVYFFVLSQYHHVQYCYYIEILHTLLEVSPLDLD